MGDKADNKVIK